MEELFTAIEVAENLRLALSTVRVWTHQGKLRPIRLGGRVVYEESELNRVIDEGRVAGQDRGSKCPRK